MENKGLGMAAHAITNRYHAAVTGRTGGYRYEQDWVRKGFLKILGLFIIDYIK